MTNMIFELSAPYNNPYQGVNPRGLFVCSAGLLRSATMANYFARKDWNTRAAGTHDYALVPLSVNLIKWANVIYFVNEENYQVALDTFKNLPDIIAILKDAIVLDIPDNYGYNDPKLLSIIEEQTNVSE